METKFTKGEWKVGEGIASVECGNDFIATCHHITEQWITEEQAIANAKLIAAAPDLLEALQEYVWMQEGNISKVTTMPSERLIKAKQAIKKATE